jgi:hypothetical protein
MTGGAYSLAGGFQAIGFDSDECAAGVRGDSNCDGRVDFSDIDCFVAALVDQAAWANCSGGGCDYACVNDINQDQHVNFDDIDPFVECLISGACQ